MISYLVHSEHYRQHRFVGDKFEDCKLGLPQDASFAVDLQGSKSTSAGLLCVFGPQAFSQIPGCARSKLQFLAAVLGQRSFRLTQV